MASEPQDSERGPAALSRSFGNFAVRLGELVLARAETALAPLGLTALAYDTMNCILQGHGMSQQELSRRLGIYAPKVVGLLDGLETQGLVERRVSPNDRRRHELLLTPKGQALLKRAVAIGAALEEELFGCVPAKDKARFGALVQQIEAEALARDPEPRA
jgi:DNA-binding MarR family transcriptional regulator